MAEHKDLTDPYLHEPKGAAAANSGEVYVANGSGSGIFKKLPLSDVDYNAASVTNLTNSITGFTQANTVSQIAAALQVNTTALASITNSSMTDVPASIEIPTAIINAINKNFKELGVVVNDYQTKIDLIRKDLYELAEKTSQIITALKSVGVITNE